MWHIYFKKEQTNPYFPRRLSKNILLRQKRRHFKLLLIFSLIDLVLIFYLLFFSSYFQIEQIEVRGANDIPSQFIIALVKEQSQENRFLIARQTNLLLFKESDFLKKIEKIIALEKINLIRDLPNKIKIDMQEKKPALVWISADKFYYLDKNGIAIREVNFFSIDPYLPIIHNQAQESLEISQIIIDQAQLNFILSLVAKMPQGVKIASIEASSQKLETLSVKFQEGWQAIFDPAQPLQIQLNNLSLALKDKDSEARKKIDYFDLRFPDRIYYKE